MEINTSKTQIETGNQIQVDIRETGWKIWSGVTRVVRKVKNVCAYNPRSCFIVPDESFDVFS